MVKVGIEKLAIYPGTAAINLFEIASQRDFSTTMLRDELMVEERSVLPLWEDSVTMAVNVAIDMLTEEDKQDIDLLIVATESGVDEEKALSTWVHRYLGLSAHCRNFEIKCACYGVTAALQMASTYLSYPLNSDKKVLIIGSDQSTMGLSQAHEYVLGCGAIAILASRKACLFELEMGKNGFYANEVSDIFRPLPWIEAGNAETSLFSYFDSLNEAFNHYCQNTVGVNLDNYFDYFVYHVPFPGIAYRAHLNLFKSNLDDGKELAKENFASKVMPSIMLSKKTGGIYSGGVYQALASLLLYSENISPGQRVGVFSYGSGSMAEYFSVLTGDAASKFKQKKESFGFDKRYQLNFEQYEYIENVRTTTLRSACVEIDKMLLGKDFFEQHYVKQRRLILNKVNDYYRYYCWGNECQK